MAGLPADSTAAIDYTGILQKLNLPLLELTQDYLDRHAQRFSYDGATAGRRAHGWYAASTDAIVELMGSLIWLRNRSRDLIRNNP